MAYERVNWENLPSTNTPVNADNLNKMDEGIMHNKKKLEDIQNVQTGTITDNVTYVRVGNVALVYFNDYEYNESSGWQPIGTLPFKLLTDVQSGILIKNAYDALAYVQAYNTNELRIISTITNVKFRGSIVLIVTD